MKTKKDQYGRPVDKKCTIEWMEHGRWVTSCNQFDSEELANEHAQFIGCHKYRVVPVKKEAANATNGKKA